MQKFCQKLHGVLQNSAMTSIVDSHLEDAMKAYAPLFQPLKDLARNWTVDLEKCLEGFVEWLVSNII